MITVLDTVGFRSTFDVPAHGRLPIHEGLR